MFFKKHKKIKLKKMHNFWVKLYKYSTLAVLNKIQNEIQIKKRTSNLFSFKKTFSILLNKYKKKQILLTFIPFFKKPNSLKKFYLLFLKNIKKN